MTSTGEIMSWVRIVALTLVMFLAHCHLGSQAAALERLTVGVAAVTAGDGGLLMAKEAGLFRDQGLEVDLVFFDSGIEGMQALASGHLPVVTGGGPSLIRAAIAGAAVVWIAELLGTMPYTLVVSPEIATPADLKGRRLGISKFGGSSDFATRFALARLNLDPTKDVTILQVGNQATRLAALRARSIDGTVIEPPGTVVARKLGFKELTDMAGLGLRYPYETVAVSKALIRERPDALRKLMRGLVIGTHAFKTRREEGIRVLGKYLKSDDVEALAETYGVYSRLISASPRVTLTGVRMVLEEIGKDDPRVKGAKPEDFVDMRFVKELEESGLIDRLYK